MLERQRGKSRGGGDHVMYIERVCAGAAINSTLFAVGGLGPGAADATEANSLAI